MNPRSFSYGSLLLLAASTLLPLATSSARAQTAAPRWVTTWGAPSSNPTNNPEGFGLGAAYGAPASFTNQTIRLMCFGSVGGSQVRVRISNLYGTSALNLGAVHVARRDSGANVVAGTDRALTFSGQPSISVPPGAVVQSDPVTLAVPALSDVAVSIYLPDAAVPNVTATPGKPELAYVAAAGTGDQTAATAYPTLGTTTSTVGDVYLATDIEVLAAGAPPSIVTFGDSITEGYQSTVDGNTSWPDRLAVRLNGGGLPAAVADLGLSGNQVLVDNFGPNGLARFDRDVLAHPNLTHVTVLEGINDIGASGGSVTAAALIQGYRQLIARAHDRGVKIIGCTLTPDKGNTGRNANGTYYSAAGEATRQAINAWLRTSAEYDGLIDFEAAVTDGTTPPAIQTAYDSGDHLHPNDAGYQAMANAVDLSLFNGFVTLNSVVSRKTHGAGAGVYDLPLPQGLCTRPGIESRGGGASGGDYSLVFSFAAPITSVLGAAVAEGVGSVASLRVNPDDPSQALVTLTGVSSGQYVTVGLTNVTDALGNTSSVRAVMGVLVGDAGGDGSVNAADIAQTRSLSGQGVTAANFRADLNLDGVINAADIAFVKSRSGTALPSPAPASANLNP